MKSKNHVWEQNVFLAENCLCFKMHDHGELECNNRITLSNSSNVCYINFQNIVLRKSKQ